MILPDRSVLQRQNALVTANSVRTFRRDLKEDLKAGRTSVFALLHNPPKKIESMKVLTLLLAAPKIGHVKANNLLRRCQISASKTVGGLTSRQKEALTSRLYW